ncbi:hypothetical protein HGRIS_014683 [Hohenbuehelia grisea]|uniref:Uncharacterized protein n=1 Tax=Hohenbuehelia grisea TaxID=104357 RepID=A0ABR3JV18_9AGAR
MHAVQKLLAGFIDSELAYIQHEPYGVIVSTTFPPLSPFFPTPSFSGSNRPMDLPSGLLQLPASTDDGSASPGALSSATTNDDLVAPPNFVFEAPGSNSGSHAPSDLPRALSLLTTALTHTSRFQNCTFSVRAS